MLTQHVDIHVSTLVSGCQEMKPWYTILYIQGNRSLSGFPRWYRISSIHSSLPKDPPKSPSCLASGLSWLRWGCFGSGNVLFVVLCPFWKIFFYDGRHKKAASLLCFWLNIDHAHLHPSSLLLKPFWSLFLLRGSKSDRVVVRFLLRLLEVVICPHYDLGRQSNNG